MESKNLWCGYNSWIENNIGMGNETEGRKSFSDAEIITEYEIGYS